VAGRIVAGRQCPRVDTRAHVAPDQRLFVSARHKRQRKSVIQNSRLSKITVAVAGVTIIVPSAVAASIATSGGSAGHGSSLMAMAGSHPSAGSGPAHLDAGIPMTEAARGEVGKLGVERVVAQRAAEQAADRRAAKRAAARRAADRRADRQAAATSSTPQQRSGGSGSSSPQPSGSPRQIAMAMLGSYGWASNQFGCLDSLWNQESGWNVYASNPSGAYGIPQALPGDKMASAGPDWQTNAATQIRWGLGYIKGLYGSPCGAWSHEEANGWY
jgi:hypothetical protein